MLEYREKLSKLFRNLEKHGGTTHLNDAVLSALIQAIHDFCEKDEQDFFQQFRGLLEDVKNTEPRIALVIDHLYHVWEALEQARASETKHDHTLWEREVVKNITDQRRTNTLEHEKIRQQGALLVQDGDVILIHSRSRTVLDVLKTAKKHGRHFSVVVAEQETDKTAALIEDVHRSKIPFRVVPEYMLSHVEKKITKVFLGALTINSELQCVADAGTTSIVTEFHVTKTPIYLFLSTRKLSLWTARQQHHTFKAKQRRLHSYRPIEFERLKFSHDRVPIDLLTEIVTEQGSMTPDEIRRLYKKNFAERKAWRKEFMKDVA